MEKILIGAALIGALTVNPTDAAPDIQSNVAHNIQQIIDVQSDVEQSFQKLDVWSRWRDKILGLEPKDRHRHRQPPPPPPPPQHRNHQPNHQPNHQTSHHQPPPQHPRR